MADNATTQEHDIIIVGGGPAGLAAAIYAARARRSALIFERKVTGGQIALTSEVENYPGFDSVNGFELADAMHKQAEKYGAQTAFEDVTAIEQDGGMHVVHAGGGTYRAKAVIVTGGADYDKLGVPGEERLTGFGVSYCATCDGAFFRDKTVAVVGGGDAAMDEALFLTRYVEKAIVVHRRDTLRASAILQERAFANPKIVFEWNTVVEGIVGEQYVTGARVRDVITGETRALDVAAVFVFIGLTPNTAFLRGKLRMDEGGHIFVNEWMETEIAGLYAAGDVRVNSARQLVTAAGDGATAAIRADRYISERFGGKPGSGVGAPDAAATSSSN